MNAGLTEMAEELAGKGCRSGAGGCSITLSWTIGGGSIGPVEAKKRDENGNSIPSSSSAPPPPPPSLPPPVHKQTHFDPLALDPALVRPTRPSWPVWAVV